MPGFPNQGLHLQRAHSLWEWRETKPSLQIPAHNLLLIAFPGALAPQSFGNVESSRVCREVCVRIVFIACFSSAHLPSSSDPKVNHGGWRDGSVLKSMDCTSQDPSFIPRSSQTLVTWAPQGWTPLSRSDPWTYVHNASPRYPTTTTQTYFLKFFFLRWTFRLGGASILKVENEETGVPIEPKPCKGIIWDWNQAKMLLKLNATLSN